MVSLQVAIAALALSSVGQTMLLDFYSDSCGPCREMNPTVQALIDAGYPVQRINVTQLPAIAQKFGVRQVPCFVMIVDGKVVDQEVGKTSRERLEQMCRMGAPAAAPPNLSIASSQPRRRLFGRKDNDQGPQPTPPAVSLPGVASNEPPAALRGSQPSEPWNPSLPPQPGPLSIPPSPMPLKAAAVPDAMLLAASVRLRIEDPDGRSCGSGTIIDSRSGEALILTCGHIFRDSQGKGRVIVELFPNGPADPQQVEGRLVSYDLTRDVGLVAIKTPGPVTVMRLAPPEYRVTPGAPVATVGCNHGDPPTVQHTQVNRLDKYQGPPNIQVAGQPVEGRSGGGLFSSEGYVIGVCNAADPSDREGLFAAPASLYAELDRSNLAFVYRSPSNGSDGTPSTASPIPSVMPGPMSGSSDLTALNAPPSPGPGAVMPAVAVEPAPQLTPQERAFLEELRRNEKEGADVICIVRPRGKPEGKSDVIMLEKASSECVRQVLADGHRQDRRYETSLELPKPRKVILEWTKPAEAP